MSGSIPPPANADRTLLFGGLRMERTGHSPGSTHGQKDLYQLDISLPQCLVPDVPYFLGLKKGKGRARCSLLGLACK
jgi:hypothetical protein